MENLNEKLTTNLEWLMNYNIDRNYDVMERYEVEWMEETYKLIYEARKLTASGDAAKFYKIYENRYDFLYDVCDRGLTLGTFIKEQSLEDYYYLFDNDKPQHFSDIPFELRCRYRQYLDSLLFENGQSEIIGDYNEERAIEEFIESIL